MNPKNTKQQQLQNLLQHCANQPETSLRLYAASNPNCPPDTLTKLADDSHIDVKLAALTNPNCPADIINQQITKNPSTDILRIIATRKTTPAETLEQIAQHKTQAYQKHPELQYTGSPEQLAVQNPNYPPEKLQTIIYGNKTKKLRQKQLQYDLLLNRSFHQIAAALTNPNCPADTLTWAYNTNNPTIHKALAANPNCPNSILQQLADNFLKQPDTDEQPYIYNALVANPNCPADILEKLTPYTKNYPYNFYKIIAHQNYPTNLLRQLATSSDQIDLWSVALNPNCPPDILAKLAKLANSQSQSIRAAVAQNPNTPPDILQTLAEEHKLQQYVLLDNPNCPLDLKLAHLDNYDLTNYHKAAFLLNQITDQLNQPVDPNNWTTLTTTINTTIHNLPATPSCPPRLANTLQHLLKIVLQHQLSNTPKTTTNLLLATKLAKDHQLNPPAFTNITTPRTTTLPTHPKTTITIQP